MNVRNRLMSQIDGIDLLRNLPFDNISYEKWRIETGEILEELFGRVNSEKHPCVQAFLAYRIPEHFSASRDEMQEFYSNILGYQSSLLKMYLADTE
jgi:hypothetical protein